MNEAPASGGESDFGGPIEAEEGFGMPAAFPPPPQEKTNENSLNGGNQPGVGGPNNTLDENGGAASPESLAELAQNGVGSSVPEEIQDFSGEQGENPTVDSTSTAETADNTPGDDEVQTIVPISSGPKGEEGSQSESESREGRAISQARSAREDVREGRVSDTESGSTTVQENTNTQAASQPVQSVAEQAPEPSPEPLNPTEGQAPETLSREAGSTVSQESTKEEADKLFLGLRGGTEVFRDKPDSPAWRASGKIVSKPGEAPHQVFKQYGGSEEREVPITQLRQIAESRAGYDRPEPLQPPPVTQKPTRLEAQTPREAVRKEEGLKELQARGAENRANAGSTSEASPEDTTAEQQAPKIVGSSPPKPDATTREGSATPPPETPKTVATNSPEGDTAKPPPSEQQSPKGPEVPTKYVIDPKNPEYRQVLPGETFDTFRYYRMGVAGGEDTPWVKMTNEERLRGGPPSTTREGSPPSQEPPIATEAATPVEKEPKQEEEKIAEITALQLGKIDKLLDAKTAAATKKRFGVAGTEAALKEAKKQLGITRRIRDSKGNLNEKFIEELRKAQEEGRIREKAPEPKPEQPTTPEKPSFSQNIKEQVGKAQEKARDLGTRGFATAERGRVAVVESMRTQAEKTKVGRFLFRQGEAFLNKFDWRDKEIGSWIVGMGFGATSTALMPIPGLSSVLRAPLLVGLNLAGTKGLNALRLRSITNALKPYFHEGLRPLGSSTPELAAKRFDDAFKLIRGNDKTAFNEEIARLSEEIAAGKPADVLGDAQTIAAEALSIKMLNISEKYANASNHIRSFAAGLSVGAIGGSFLPELNLDIPGLGGGPEDASVSPEAPSPEVSFTEPLNSQIIPPEIASTPNAAENWETFANHWNTLDTGQREDFLNIMSDPDQVTSLEAWAEAHSAVVPELEPVQSILGSPENFTALDIAQGDTVGQLATDNGYTNFWEANPDNAALKGLTIEENRALLEQATKNATDAGLATEAIPSEAELVNLMNRAATGDLAANARLNEALHWIPEGAKLKLLNESVLSEAVKNLKLTS